MDLETAQILVRQVEPGARVCGVTPLLGGVSGITERIDLRRTDGEERRVVVRRYPATRYLGDPGCLAREARLLGLARAGGVPSPEVYFLDETGALIGEPCLIVEHIDGMVEFGPDDSLARAREMGALLGVIHALPRVAIDLPALGARPAPASGGATDGDEVLAHARDRVLGWDGWARGAETVLHGDFWPGNVLWRDGRIAAVIDWEDARLGDPHADLAIGRLDQRWLFGDAASAAFTEAYRERAPVDEERLALWDLRAALRPGDQLPLWATAYAAKGRPDVTATTMHAERLRFAAEALARLDAQRAPRPTG